MAHDGACFSGTDLQYVYCSARTSLTVCCSYLNSTTPARYSHDTFMQQVYAFEGECPIIELVVVA